MPTTVIETNISAPPFQRRVAKAVAFCLQKQGVPINHSIVKFNLREPSHVFSGPYPFDRFPGGVIKPDSFAFVECYIDRTRTTQFRSELVRTIVQAMQPEITPAFIYISFRPVDPLDYVNGTAISSGRIAGGPIPIKLGERTEQT